ncbi:hypothetical protein BD779DRAFT_1533952 [Infundibulicybe gibba]|nr:hypothetical protein BD779DRAFT_1533952 [Infundibulicybe gibba]
MAPSSEPHPTLDAILNQITTSNNAAALGHTLRTALPRDTREAILAGLLGGGQDPLSVLDMRTNTLGALYILSARAIHPGAVPPPWAAVLEFCERFIPEDARLAPDRVTLLAKGIIRLAAQSGNNHWAIQPLYNLVTRYPYDSSYLTTIHPIFILTCVSTRYFAHALPVLENPITNIDTGLSDLHYNDSLVYHYTGGVALAALQRWAQAEEYFEICITGPGTVPSAIQLEALKKLRLVQLISRGKTGTLPKYTHQLLPRALKNTPYHAFANAYPHNPEQLCAIFENHRLTFAHEKTTGLIIQAIERAPRWVLKKLTATYVTLGLADIARAIRMDSEHDVRGLILSMIESGDISAHISADGTVTFSDPAPEFSRGEVDRVLRDAQTQSALLEHLDMEMARSKEFLNKAVRNREEMGAWAPSAEEEMYGSLAAGNAWSEETIFA